MSYRFLKLTTISPEYLEHFRSYHPNFESLSYDEIYDRYVKSHLGWSDYYPRHLASFGNHAQELFTSFEVLQKAWAREHNIKYDRRMWLKEIVFAQVKEFRPDVIFLEDLYLYDSVFRKALRDACSAAVVIVGYRCAPTDDYDALKDVDLLLTCVPNFAELMRQAGARVAILRHAFEPSVLQDVGKLTRDLDLTFVGNLILRNGVHNQRYTLVKKLLESTPLQAWTLIRQKQPLSTKQRARQSLGRVRSYLAGAKTQTQPKVANDDTDALLNYLVQNFSDRFHSPAFGLDNYRVLGRSRMTFNSHIDCAEDYAGNMRLFEATGMGTCLITDWKRNLNEMFEPEAEIVTYRNAEECSEKVNYLLAHEDERESIALAGHQRTMRCHTFARRAAELNELILQSLA